ncbi:MAG: UDP-N-acetylmuramate--L-alanine ligase [Pseudomonadota bacterium]
MFRGRVRQIHFVGIGGIGMSGIAEVLLNLGFQVSGSDLSRGETCERLAQLGATIFTGHDAANLGEVDVVVTSSAVRPTNPEVTSAHQRGIPVIPRAEMLAELMRLKHGVAIAGTHGKTTTTSLVAAILGQAGLDPTIVIGGKVNALGTNARLGQGDYLVAEADESDGSFLHLSPTVAVVTNIDPEHLDHWTGGLPEILDAFTVFANKVPFFGLDVLCLDHPGVQAILPRVTRRHVTYGLSPQADYRAENIQFEGLGMRYTVLRRGEVLGEIRLNMVGAHNVLNSLAAIAVADELGAPFDAMAQGLAGFGGVARRFSILADDRDITIVDDYGHHPAEIRAVLDAARRVYSDRHLRVLFQPHRYTRTRDLIDEFATCFHLAESVVVTDIYAASEDAIPGISGESLARAIRERGHRDARYCAFDALLDDTAAQVHAGDVVFTLGAGNITSIGPKLARRLNLAVAHHG